MTVVTGRELDEDREVDVVEEEEAAEGFGR